MSSRVPTAVVALGLLLCGISPGAAAPRPKTHTVVMVDAMRFEPATLVIRPGDTVIWVNKDVVQHTATADDGAFNSPAVAPGASWKRTLRKKGRLPYGCRFHPMMKGLIEIK